MKDRARTAGWASPVLIIIVGGLAYLNSFEGVFVFDDLALKDNPYIRHLWPPWPSMFGLTQADRPLNGLSFAINYAISGFHLWSYHAINLLIHLLAALALFGILRLTLSKQPREPLASHATPLALVITLIWTVHPLQTESVTYIVQRCESMMGMFYLATLYFAIRGFWSERPRWWFVASVAACAAGMMSKQVMVTAPLVVLAYDFLFVSKSPREIFSKRWPLYTGLAATWGILAFTVMRAQANLTAGFAVSVISPLRYFVTQFSVTVHYLRLSVWPSSLCINYVWPQARTAGQIVPYGLVLVAFGAATVWGFVRRNGLSFLGVWFFLILGVTSSIMPFSDLVFEHRMYLPLASVVTLVVLAAYKLGLILVNRLDDASKQHGRTLALGSATLVIALLTFATVQRNIAYKSGIVMWSDVISKQPNSIRAHTNLGIFLNEAGKIDESIREFEVACQLGPHDWEAQNDLGMALLDQGRVDEAIPHLRTAVEFYNNSPKTLSNLALAMIGKGQLDTAIALLIRALKYDPRYARAHFRLAMALDKKGDPTDAGREYKIAAELDPDLAAQIPDHSAARD